MSAGIASVCLFCGSNVGTRPAYAEAAKPAQTYYACCSSTYVRRRESWMLVAHQQSALANIEQQLTERSALGVFFNS